MAPKTMDKYLEAGFVGINVKHPITGQMQENLLDMSTYPQTTPGVKKFAADVKSGEIAEVHAGATLADLAEVAFAKMIKDKGADFLSNALARVDDSIAKLQREAALDKWRDALAAMDNGGTQEAAIALFDELEAAKAALADVEASIAEARNEVAQELDIDKTFDLALVSTGWYISSDVKTKGSKTTVKRDYTADLYTSKKGRKINGVAVHSEAQVTSRDDDGNPDGWKVVYTAKKKTYAASGKSLNAANKEAREACMDVIAKGMSTASNAPKWFRVPRIAS